MTYYADDTVTLHLGDAATVLATLPDGSVDCVVTSPPYFGLRDYGVSGQIGAEASPAAFVAALVAVFAELRRVLADDGVMWLNVGDSYTGGGGFSPGSPSSKTSKSGKYGARGALVAGSIKGEATGGLTAKNLLGIPWRLAFALQDDSWILRNAAIWHKPNAMPESVTDRLSNRYEHVFLFSKSRRYWFDLDPIREPHITGDRPIFDIPNKGTRPGGWSLGTGTGNHRDSASFGVGRSDAGRNPGDVWSIPTAPFPGAHFAAFPPELPRRCILAGCPERVCATCGHTPTRIEEKGDLVPSREGSTTTKDQAQARGHNGITGARLDFSGGGAPSLPRSERTTTGWTDCGHNAYRPGVVIDPFHGSGTTGMVAQKLGRRYVGIDLNAEYLDLSLRTRLNNAALPFEMDTA